MNEKMKKMKISLSLSHTLSYLLPLSLPRTTSILHSITPSQTSSPTALAIMPEKAEKLEMRLSLGEGVGSPTNELI